MGATAKDIRVAPIAAADANALVQRIHYSGRIVHNSQLHLGAFLDGRLEGAMQFGPSLDKRKVLGLVRDTPWNGFLELNRMAFSDRLPRNSESRALGVALRMIRRQYPHIQWVISFADGTQCGDGTIYRAAGFLLTQIKRNTSIWQMGEQKFTDIAYRTGPGVRQLIYKSTETHGGNCLGRNGSAGMAHLIAAGARPLAGFQLRYIYFLDPGARARLACPVLPYSEIDRQGARMYRGKRASEVAGAAPGVQPGEGGSTPTPTLQNEATGGHQVPSVAPAAAG